jgi:1-aminocyclopropane-1-carboxylate deaminase/D-cysteine desulfhydrase-like pyridoxal-dependent ACC family enzyme
VPSGNFTPELTAAKANGATVIQHKPGYNSVIVKRAKDDALANPTFTHIPFGMECLEAIEQTKYQIQNIPKEAKRIVVPVGSAMTLAGILNGLVEYKIDIPVIGIVVGADPTKRLDHYAPVFWRKRCILIWSTDNYHLSRNNIYLDNILLDPIYEAKCVPTLQPEDLFWIVGIRNI